MYSHKMYSLKLLEKQQNYPRTRRGAHEARIPQISGGLVNILPYVLLKTLPVDRVYREGSVVDVF